MGKVNFYHEFIPKSTLVLESFHNLLRKDIPFKWTQQCQNSFEQVKKSLSSPPILAVFDPFLTTHLYTDASGKGVDAVLKQIHKDGLEKPVAYFSKRLNKAQKRKNAIYIETLAIREAVRY